MIGLICAYFIGKYFYKLAKDYNQNKIIYCILGVFCFYFGTAVLGNLIVFYFREFTNYNLSFFSFLRMNFLAMPFGIGLSCLVHYLLEKKWKSATVVIKDEIHDIGKRSDE